MSGSIFDLFQFLANVTPGGGHTDPLLAKRHDDAVAEARAALGTLVMLPAVEPTPPKLITDKGAITEMIARAKLEQWVEEGKPPIDLCGHPFDIDASCRQQHANAAALGRTLIMVGSAAGGVALEFDQHENLVAMDPYE